jgi:hypothetical protein
MMSYILFVIDLSIVKVVVRTVPPKKGISGMSLGGVIVHMGGDWSLLLHNLKKTMKTRENVKILCSNLVRTRGPVSGLAIYSRAFRDREDARSLPTY